MIKPPNDPSSIHLNNESQPFLSFSSLFLSISAMPASANTNDSFPLLHHSPPLKRRSTTTTTTTTTTQNVQITPNVSNGGGGGGGGGRDAASSMRKKKGVSVVFTMMVRCHPAICLLAMSLLFFMGVEYSLRMVPSDSPPFDLGFAATRWLNVVLASRPRLNTFLAGMNTVFVGMQTAYIFWTFLVEGRLRPGVAMLFMFTCRGILGYSTQLPLPQDFLGSGADFPVGNVSFFLFFSGHVAGAVIASLDMRRMHRKELAWMFDVFNALQALRLLGTRGHYTIDLAVGVGAGVLFDYLAGKYEESKKTTPLNSSFYAPLS